MPVWAYVPSPQNVNIYNLIINGLCSSFKIISVLLPLFLKCRILLILKGGEMEADIDHEGRPVSLLTGSSSTPHSLLA